MEILRQHPKKIDAVFCCVGGGGLIAGVVAYIKRLRPDTKIIGVEAVDADAMDRSLKAGKRVKLDRVGPVRRRRRGEDGRRGNLPPRAQQYVDEMVLVDTDAICAAIRMYSRTRAVLEPAGALAVAGAKEYAKRHKLEGDKTLVAIAPAPT